MALPSSFWPSSFFDSSAAARTVPIDFYIFSMLAICVLDVAFALRQGRLAYAVFFGLLTLALAALYLFLFFPRHLEDWATWWQELQSRPFIAFNV